MELLSLDNQSGNYRWVKMTMNTQKDPRSFETSPCYFCSIGCISQGFLEKQNKYDICIYKEIYYKKLAHIIMETQKAHDLPLASCRPRKADGLVLV